MAQANFGEEIRREFLLQDNYTFLNHGSFGSVPKSIVRLRQRLTEEIDRNPDHWYLRKRNPMWQANIDAVASFLGSKPDNLVFTANITTAINAVLKSLPLKAGDAVLLNSLTYHSFNNLTNLLVEEKGIIVRRINFPYPIESEEQIIALYEDTLRNYTDIRVVLLDVISSRPAVKMPLQPLIKVCRKYNTYITVDGAHAPGQLELNVEDLGVDFFAGNLHKWLYTARGCGVLWIRPEYHNLINPTVISLFYEKGNLSSNFNYLGTADTCQYYTVEAAIQFYQSLGGMNAIVKYNSDLISRAAEMLAVRWNTSQFSVPSSMLAPYMRQIALPQLNRFQHYVNLGDKTGKDVWELMALMWDRFRINAFFTAIYGKIWVRISVNVYNCLKDYEALADAVLELVREEQDEAITLQLPAACKL